MDYVELCNYVLVKFLYIAHNTYKLQKERSLWAALGLGINNDYVRPLAIFENNLLRLNDIEYCINYTPGGATVSPPVVATVTGGQPGQPLLLWNMG